MLLQVFGVLAFPGIVLSGDVMQGFPSTSIPAVTGRVALVIALTLMMYEYLQFSSVVHTLSLHKPPLLLRSPLCLAAPLPLRLAAPLPLCLSASLLFCLSASLPLCPSAPLPPCLSAPLPSECVHVAVTQNRWVA